jgi:hypothetical protein
MHSIRPQQNCRYIVRIHIQVPAQLLMLVGGLLAAVGAQAKEDLEYVQEHLAEVPMDNRFATLPLWRTTDDGSANVAAQVGYADIQAGELNSSGPMLAIAGHWRLTPNWEFRTFGFYDSYQLSSGLDRRDLQTLFAPQTPLTRPVAAEFSGLDGSAKTIGVGVNVAWDSSAGILGDHRWIGGLLWQRISLEDYRFQYLISAGPEAGTTGTIDFDADYSHVVPFVGLELPRNHGRWSTNAHVLFALPWPRGSVHGHITGPDFDIHGDTAAAGHGTHFGDASLTLGYTITYHPAHLSVDVGTLLTQWLLEPYINPGIDRNLVLSFSMDW